MISSFEKIRDFETQIKSINVKDFGDFRRKANSYLIRLDEALKPRPTKVEQLMREIQNYVNFEPNWQTDPTRRYILTMVEKMKKEFRELGHS